MSIHVINPTRLLDALKDQHARRARPISPAELAEAYAHATGQRFNSDSLTRHLTKHVRAGLVTRTKDARGRYHYAPSEENRS